MTTTLAPLTIPRTRSRSQTRSLPTRTRDPLSTLPITMFIPPANTLPSPVSLPTKRGPSTSTEEMGPSARKVSRSDKEKKTPRAEGSGSLRRTSPAKGSTPRSRVVLDRDELGTGRSPVRRLFADPDDGRRISGISGAISTPPIASSSSYRLDSPSQPSSLASTPSPDPSAFGLEGIEYDFNVSIHDPGFVIHPDELSNQPSSSTGLRTPRSRRAAREQPTPTPSISLPSSPSALHDMELDDQENMPPPPDSPPTGTKRSHSLNSTPSKHSSASTSESDISSYLHVSPQYFRSPSASASGSGTRRRERSKLANEVFVLRGEAVWAAQDVKPVEAGQDQDEDEDGEELTPGRKAMDVKGKGRAREALAIEVDAL